MTRPLWPHAVAIVAAWLIVGCSGKDVSVNDQCMRREIFKECMAGLPKGPTHIGTSNDWDEVVRECEHSAYYESMRKKDQVKMECRP